MKGDFSRSTFDRRNHYSSVRMQQGRVQLDADWNEQADLTRYRIETEAADLIGGCGAPLHADGFRTVETAADLTPEEAARIVNADVPTLEAGDFLITGGRMYVRGRLAECDAIARYRAQPHLPDPGAAPAGTYVAYLDVWDRHLTALEEPELREVALGGPDTATRTQTVWQVKLLDVTEETPDGGITCASPLDAWNALVTPPDGQMSARAEESAASTNPCIVTPGAGYRALENRLYRVEVYGTGTRDAVAFKWSRDNGTVAARWTGETPIDAASKRITVSTLGRDAVLRFLPGTYVELTDDAHELAGLPGTLVEVTRAEDGELTLDLTTAIGTETDLADYDNPRVRRWDGVLQNVTNANFVALEDGVQVRFFAGSFRNGDYWTVPARTATADVEWPVNNAGTALRLSPFGIEHRYCKLGVLTSDGETWTDVEDCRPLFPPVTELTSLFYVSGDGQEATPRADGAGTALDHPLQVGVANGRWPVAGASVRFRVTQGGGAVNGVSETVVETGADGVAGVGWTLGGDVEALQQVEATLLDAGGAAIHLPIRFTARYREGAVEEPGFHVLRIEAGGAPLVNDAELSADRLARGIEVRCDAPFIDTDAFGPRKPVCFVTLYLPWPFQREDLNFWGAQLPVATHPIRLNARAAADDDSIFWNAETDTGAWLRGNLFNVLEEFGYERPILGYLTLKGDFIWEQENPRRYLDGEVFGELREDGGTDARLPSGDRRRGGDLEVWFHLVRSEGEPDIRVEPDDLVFGLVPAGGTAELAFDILNQGLGALVVSAMRIDSAVFQVLDPAPFSIDAGGSRRVRVRFSPSRAQQHTATLTIDSNDPDARPEQRTVNLFGEGFSNPTPRRRARVQLIHNVASVPVRLRVGDDVLVDTLAPGEATPFFDIVAQRARVQVEAADSGEVIDQIEVTFVNGQAYGLVLCGAARQSRLILLENARETSQAASDVDVRVFNGILSPPVVTVLREANASFSLDGCRPAEAYATLAPGALTVLVQQADGQQGQTFAFDLRQQGGQAFTMLSVAVALGSGPAFTVYGIDGQGRRILPIQNRGGLVIAGPSEGGRTRVGRQPDVARGEVTTVRGVGEAFAERLGEIGIRNAGQLMTYDADRLAAKLGIGADRAADIIREARALLPPR